MPYNWIVAHNARNSIEAQMLKSLLESEGLQCIVPGEDLNDEFGMAAKLAGTSACTLLVPHAQAKTAEAVLKEWNDLKEIEKPG